MPTPEFGPPPPFAQADLINVLTRNFEDHWIQGLLADPTSFSIFVGMIGAVLRVQTAGDTNFDIASYILTAPGGAPAQSVVLLQRPSGNAGTIPTTQRFRDQNGAVWTPTAAVSVPSSAGVQTIAVPIQTQRVGYYLNTFQAPTFVLLDVPFDPNFVVVAGTTPATGGTSPFLDLHGGERKVPRAPNETDAVYRHRMLQIPDQVSPHAIADAVQQTLAAYPNTAFIANLIGNYGLRCVLEPFTDSSQKAIVDLAGKPIFFADDAFADDVNGPRVVDYQDSAAEFDVLIPTPQVNGVPDVAFSDPGTQLAIASLADMLDKKRAVGVKVRIIAGENGRLIQHPTIVQQNGAWTIQGTLPPLALTLAQAVASHDGDSSYARIASAGSAGVGVDPTDLLFAFPAIPTPVSVQRVVLRAAVRFHSIGVGVNPVLQFVLSTPTAGTTSRLNNLGIFPVTVTHTDWREYEMILNQNPLTGSAWTPADVSSGSVIAGLANQLPAGNTDELWCTEFSYEITASYG